MANGNGRRDRLLELLQQGGSGMIGPVDLDPATRDTTRVIDMTGRRPMRQSRSIQAGANALQERFQTPFQQPQQAQPARQGADMGLNAEGIPNALARPQQQQQQTQGGDPLIDALTQGEGIEQAEMPQTQSRRHAEDRLTDFAGSRIENATPVGVPEPEEITGLGKALSQFGKALETPGFQRFLSEMGIAFSGGRPDAPGTILGQQNIQALDAQAEADVLQRLMAGESLEDIDLSEIRNVESVRAATDVGMAQQEMKQRQAEREVDVEMRQERLDQFARGLDIQQERVNIDRLRILSQASQVDAPEDVSTTEHGIALDMVGTSRVFADAAEQAIKSSNPSLSDARDIMAFLRGEDGHLDPNAVRKHLPTKELQDEFDRQVLETARAVSRGLVNQTRAGEGLDFTPGLEAIQDPATRMSALRSTAVQVSSDAEVAQLAPGTIFIGPGGEIMVRTSDGRGYREIEAE